MQLVANNLLHLRQRRILKKVSDLSPSQLPVIAFLLDVLPCGVDAMRRLWKCERKLRGMRRGEDPIPRPASWHFQLQTEEMRGVSRSASQSSQLSVGGVDVDAEEVTLTGVEIMCTGRRG